MALGRHPLKPRFLVFLATLPPPYAPVERQQRALVETSKARQSFIQRVPTIQRETAGGGVRGLSREQTSKGKSAAQGTR